MEPYGTFYKNNEFKMTLRPKEVPRDTLDSTWNLKKSLGCKILNKLYDL